MKHSIHFYNSRKQIPQAAPPIWFMRQAGRYHKHYQTLRKEYDFMSLCKRPEMAARAALGPIEDFDFDVAIVFSDLLFPLEALGLRLSYQPEPKIEHLLTRDVLKKTNSVEQMIAFLAFQEEALACTRKLLPEDKSLVGFVGGLWTLFSYAVEGRHTGHLSRAKQHLWGKDPLFPAFCEKMIPVLHHNIAMQLEKGAEVVFIFDTAAGQLSEDLYRQWIAPFLGTLARDFPHRLAYFAKGITENIYKLDCFNSAAWAGLVYDHRWSLPSVLRARNFPDGPGLEKESKPSLRRFTQGNFDPALLCLPPAKFKPALADFLKPFQALGPQERAGWICSLGHGVLADTPEENVNYFVRHVRETFA